MRKLSRGQIWIIVGLVLLVIAILIQVYAAQHGCDVVWWLRMRDCA